MEAGRPVDSAGSLGSGAAGTCRSLWIGVSAVLVIMATAPGLTAASHEAPPGSDDPFPMELLELLVEDDGDADRGRWMELLLDLSARPVNLNRASRDELLQIPFLSPRHVDAMLEYRSRRAFTESGDVTRVAGIGAVTYRRIEPFVFVDQSDPMVWLDPGFWTDRGRVETLNRYQRTLEPQRGYRAPQDSSVSYYTGSPVRYYQRFSYRSRRISLNLTQLKQPGERLQTPFHFDVNSLHAAVSGVGRLQKAVIGDYGLSFGQGLVFSSKWGGGKGRETAWGSYAREQGVQPSRSSGVAGLKKGAAFTYGGRLQLTGFYSDRKLSATWVPVTRRPAAGGVETGVAAEGLQDATRYPSLSGYHRTPLELERRHNTGLRSYGGWLNYRRSFGTIGGGFYEAVFHRPVVRRDTPAGRYVFQGTRASVLGVNFRFKVGNVHTHGEAARSRNGASAWVTGVVWPVGDRTTLNMTARSYDPDYQSLFAGAFAERGGDTRNEYGLYIGVEHTPFPFVELRGYFDQFRFPAPVHGTRAPTQGHDWLLESRMEAGETVSGYLTLRRKQREGEMVYYDGFPVAMRARRMEDRATLRAQLEYHAGRRVRFRTRLEGVTAAGVDGERTRGLLIFQDVRIGLLGTLQLDGRVTMFDTGGHAARIYHFESDLLYAMSTPALSGTGQRMYIMAAWRSPGGVTLQAKYALTRYEDRLTVGSGLNESPGNIRSTLGVQLRVSLQAAFTD